MGEWNWHTTNSMTCTTTILSGVSTYSARLFNLLPATPSSPDQRGTLSLFFNCSPSHSFSSFSDYYHFSFSSRGCTRNSIATWTSSSLSCISSELKIIPWRVLPLPHHQVCCVRAVMWRESQVWMKIEASSVLVIFFFVWWGTWLMSSALILSFHNQGCIFMRNIYSLILSNTSLPSCLLFTHWPHCCTFIFYQLDKLKLYMSHILSVGCKQYVCALNYCVHQPCNLTASVTLP